LETLESCVESVVFFNFPSLTVYFNRNDDQSPMGTEVGRVSLGGLATVRDAGWASKQPPSPKVVFACRGRRLAALT